jgi:hypothetical protein
MFETIANHKTIISIKAKSGFLKPKNNRDQTKFKKS